MEVHPATHRAGSHLNMSHLCSALFCSAHRQQPAGIDSVTWSPVTCSTKNCFNISQSAGSYIFCSLATDNLIVPHQSPRRNIATCFTAWISSSRRPAAVLWQCPPSLSASAADVVHEMVPGINDLEMLTFGLYDDQCGLSAPPLPANWFMEPATICFAAERFWMGINHHYQTK